MQLYKLTDADGYTRRGQTNETLWGEGVAHEAHGLSRDLCTDGLINACENPLVAVFMNPIHDNIANPILWVCETDDVPVREGQLSCGVSTLTTVQQVELPVITTLQRVEIGIRAVLAVSVSPSFRDWAKEWLSGEDRSSAMPLGAALSEWSTSEWSSAERAKWAERVAWAWAEATRLAVESKGDLDLISIIELVINRSV